MKDRLPEIDVDVLLFFASYGTMAVGSMLYDDGEHWTCNTGGDWYTDRNRKDLYRNIWWI